MAAVELNSRTIFLVTFMALGIGVGVGVGKKRKQDQLFAWLKTGLKVIL